MALKELGNAVGDFAKIGVLIGKRAMRHATADERDLAPGMVSELVDRLHPKRMRAEVSLIIDESSTTKTLRMTPVDEPFSPFRAGQFVNMYVKIGKVETSRPYSISSSPTNRSFIDITVKEKKDGFVSKHLLSKTKVGDEFLLSGPVGYFYHEPLMDTDDLVFLAGGSGITPFMSMIREEADKRTGKKIHLIYGSRGPDDVIFSDELDELTSSLDGLKVDMVMSEPPDDYEGLCGLLEADMIKKLVGSTKGKTFYMCGPLAMYDLCEGALATLEIEPRRIKTELPGPPPDITLVDGWPKKIKKSTEFEVKVEGKRKKFTVKATEPLMNSLERNGIFIDSLCRSGECGYCRIKLVEGEVFMPPSFNVKKADAIFGYIHPCMSYPMSDITISL